MKDRIDIIGATGLVGSVVKQKIDGLVRNALSSKELDITDRKNVEGFVSITPSSTILLSSAFTDVEVIQKDPTLALKVNVEGTKNVAEACKKYNKKLIYISSDFVFSGVESNKGPYRDSDSPEPEDSKLIGEYARTKLMGENVVKNSGCKFAIVRIAYPFGNPENEKDFARKTLKLVQSGYSLFSDQQFTLTYIPDLAKAIEKIIMEDLNGTFHVACIPVTTPLEFGKYLIEKTGLDFEVKSGSLKEFMAGRTPKPLFGGLIPSSVFDVKSWKDAVDEFFVKIKS